MIVEVSGIGLTQIVDSLKNGAEMRGTIQIDISEAVFVVLDNLLEPVYSRVKNVTVHRKAV